MKRDRVNRRAPTARQVITCGPAFLAPMAQWKPLAAAVSKAEFDEHMAAFDKFVEQEFRRLGVEPGNYDELARKLSRHELTRGKDESAKDFCQRVLLRRRRAVDKPLDQAFRRPGRRTRPRLPLSSLS